MELNFIFIMGSLDSGSFIIKFNKTELHTLSETYKDCNSLYNKYRKFLVL